MKNVFIVPYFGKFPNYFQLFLNSCKFNKDFSDWIFYTDDYTNYNYPDNCYVKYCTFEELRTKIQKKFDFTIKLCDFRPAYGYIFKDDIQNYNFWGHCDVDCIFGKLSKFLNDQAFKNDRILRLGHLCLYKNNDEVNKRFMLPINNIYRYKEVFSNNKNCIFDEYNSSQSICIDDIWNTYGFSQFLGDKMIANVQYKSNSFRLVYQIDKHLYEHEPYKKAVFYWEDGCIIRQYINNNKLIEEEFAYIHLMKRNMKNQIKYNYKGPYKIIPNVFEPVKELPKSLEEFKSEKKKYINNQYLRTRFNNLKIKIKKKLKK